MKKLITTPIYYVNDVPHIGHTYTTIAADVLTRYWSQVDRDGAVLLTGTDEHGAKIAEAAKKHSKQPQEYANQIAQEFKTSWEQLNIEFKRFIRTTDSDHKKQVEQFLQTLYDNGYIEKKPRLYTGLYCISCEKFWHESDLKDGLCPDHLKPPIKHSEENYYFKLSAFQSQLKDKIISGEIKILPETRKHEILGKLELGLQDISISRANLDWGIPLPFDNSHTAYVWIDALINYYTFGKQENIWPAFLHLVGKDILWFHTVIWPAMLIGIGEKTPQTIFAHGFFTIEGQKMSKTIGNVIKPAELVNRYGVDGSRYVLLSAFPFGEDGDFSWELFDRIYNADLANGLGNLVARIAKLCERCNYILHPEEQEQEHSVDTLTDQKLNFSNLNFSAAIANAQHFLRQLDQKLSEDKPWEKDNDELKQDLKYYVDNLIKTIKLLRPFIPLSTEKILNQFSGSIKSQPPLFPRV